MTNVPQKIQDRIDELASMIYDIDAECAASEVKIAGIQGIIRDREETRASIKQELSVLDFAVGEYEKAGSQAPLPLSSASPNWQSPTPVFDALVAQKQPVANLRTMISACLGARGVGTLTASEIFGHISASRPVTRGGIAGTMSGMSRRGEIVKHPDGWALAK